MEQKEIHSCKFCCSPKNVRNEKKKLDTRFLNVNLAAVRLHLHNQVTAGLLAFHCSLGVLLNMDIQ